MRSLLLVAVKPTVWQSCKCLRNQGRKDRDRCGQKQIQQVERGRLGFGVIGVLGLALPFRGPYSWP